MSELSQKIIIAIDGYSSCGKSSFAKLIAGEVGYVYIDSGAMYRAISLYALSHKLIEGEKVCTEKITEYLPGIKISFSKDAKEMVTMLNGENVEKEIRSIEVSSVVSEISRIPEVRERLVELQRDMGRNKGVVMDGRDIGTVVFPQAEMKIFMTAETGIRAKRRFDELKAKGIPASLETIEANIISRDYKDMNREHSPLRKAEDALILDNSYMTFDEQMIWFREELEKKGFLKK
ncbi:MAG: (d)CMP kinase [Bacteroidales bacterium]|jgi:cytidylate kinase